MCVHFVKIEIIREMSPFGQIRNLFESENSTKGWNKWVSSDYFIKKSPETFETLQSKRNNTVMEIFKHFNMKEMYWFCLKIANLCMLRTWTCVKLKRTRTFKRRFYVPIIIVDYGPNSGLMQIDMISNFHYYEELWRQESWDTLDFGLRILFQIIAAGLIFI